MRNLDLLIQQREKPKAGYWTWATVVTDSPLQIRMDGDTTPLDITPENLVGPLSAGERVWVQVEGRRALVTGKAGGAGVPTGSVQMYMGATAPEGWLLCDGSTFTTGQYPELEALLGGTTLPDMRSRFPVGHEPGSNSIGGIGGSPTITKENLPPHTHSMNHSHPDGTTSTDGRHDHTVDMTNQTSVNNFLARGSSAGDVTNTSSKPIGYNGDHSHTVTIPQHEGSTGTGSWEGLNNEDYWPRFTVVNYIIKT